MTATTALGRECRTVHNHRRYLHRLSVCKAPFAAAHDRQFPSPFMIMTGKGVLYRDSRGRRRWFDAKQIQAANHG